MKENTESSYSVVYDGSNNLTAQTSISSYNGNNLEFTIYNFQIFAVNIIVALFDNSFTENNSNSPSSSATLQSISFYSNYKLSGDDLSSFTWSDKDKSVYIQSYDSTNTIMNTGSIFMYDIRDYYTINPLNPYSLCERLTDNSDSHYNNDIFSSESDYIKGIFHDNNDSTYSANYNLIKWMGYFKNISIIQ